jgi:Flp pilus assembly protein TadB
VNPPTWVSYAVAGVIFLGLAALVLTLAWPGSSARARIREIDHFGPGRVTATRTAEPSAGGAFARTALAATASVVRSGRMEQRIALRLARAGMTTKPHEWVLLQACAVVAGAALLYVLMGWSGAVVGAALGWLLMTLYRTIRTDRRTTLFNDQLPDALQLVIGSLKAGFSLPQALDSLVREAPEPVAAEIGRATSEHRLGADVSDALERVAVRARSEDLAWAVMAVRIQREVGGNLAEVLQTTVDTMRERARLRRHVRALSAEGRISAWILIGLPIALGGFMFLFRADYLAPLFTERLGQFLVLGGSLLFVVGIFWMTRVIRVEA